MDATLTGPCTMFGFADVSGGYDSDFTAVKQ